MANKQDKQALKRRTEKRHRRAQAKKAQAGRTVARRLPLDLAARAPNGSSLPKLSAQIWDFAEPLTSAAPDAEGEKRAADLAIICWNAALLPEEKRDASIRPALRDIADGDARLETELLDIFEMMYRRKHALFANDRRFIFDYSLTDTPEGLHLFVASSPLSTEKAAAAFPD
jgi:hypothetical protein